MIVKRTVFVVALGIALLAGGASRAEFIGDLSDAEALQMGIAAVQAEDYQTALRKLLPLAVQGNAEAQNQIAWMHVNGYGVSMDVCAAIIWAEKAARQGHPFSALLMARGYSSGLGVRKSQEMAYRWILFADKMDHPTAHDELDLMAMFLTSQQRAALDREVEIWDPAKLPAPEFFIIDGSVTNDPEFIKELPIKYKAAFCR